MATCRRKLYARSGCGASLQSLDKGASTAAYKLNDVLQDAFRACGDADAEAVVSARFQSVFEDSTRLHAKRGNNGVCALMKDAHQTAHDAIAQRRADKKKHKEEAAKKRAAEHALLVKQQEEARAKREPVVLGKATGIAVAFKPSDFDEKVEEERKSAAAAAAAAAAVSTVASVEAPRATVTVSRWTTRKLRVPAPVTPANTSSLIVCVPLDNVATAAAAPAKWPALTAVPEHKSPVQWPKKIEPVAAVTAAAAAAAATATAEVAPVIEKWPTAIPDEPDVNHHCNTTTEPSSSIATAVPEAARPVEMPPPPAYAEPTPTAAATAVSEIIKLQSDLGAAHTTVRDLKDENKKLGDQIVVLELRAQLREKREKQIHAHYTDAMQSLRAMRPECGVAFDLLLAALASNA